LLFVAAFFAATIVAQGIISPILLGLFHVMRLNETVAFYIQAIAALLATWFALRVVDKKPWSEVGLHRDALAAKGIGIALVAGGGAIAAAILILIASGWLARAGGTTTTWAGPLVRITALLLPAAFGEELIARGYAFTAIRDGLGSRWAVVITSAAFGLLHLTNPGANAQSVTLVALAGVFLAIVRLSTDSLYAAWAAHFAWNWVMAAIFHAPVSGFAFEYPAYRYVDAGPDWATGGSWGPESGVPAGLMMLAGIFILSRGAARDLLLRRRTDG
jgi:membrane protease YdiL (CAAX protease family)